MIIVVPEAGDTIPCLCAVLAAATKKSPEINDRHRRCNGAAAFGRAVARTWRLLRDYVLHSGDSSSAADCCWAAAHDWPHRGGCCCCCCSYCRLCSSSSSWPIKLRFGDMIGRAALTILYASTMVAFRWRITYAMAMVGDRDMPAWQCMRTLPPDFRAPSKENNRKKKLKPILFS